MCTHSASVHSSKLFGIGWWKFFEWLFLCLHYANKGFLLFWIKLGILIFANKLKWDFDFSIETLFDGTCQCLNSCLNQICCVDEFYKVIFFSLLLTNLNFLAKVSGKQLQKLNFEHGYIFLFEHLMPKSDHIKGMMWNVQIPKMPLSHPKDVTTQSYRVRRKVLKSFAIV